MELEFQLTKENYQEFSRHGNQKIMEANKNFSRGRYALYFLLFILLVYFDDQRYQYAVVGVALGFIFYLYYYHLWLNHYKMTKWTVLDPQKVVFTKKEIRVETPKAKSVLKWKYFFVFEETENLFLLFIDSNLANIIPKRAFKDEAQMEKFRKLCKDNIPAQN